MIRWIVEYLKSLKCEHNWRIQKVNMIDEFGQALYTKDYWICEKCGYSKVIKYK